MNIIEALKSGRRFRRKGEECWHVEPIPYGGSWYSVEVIIADDWEVEEEKFEITETQLRRVATRWFTTPTMPGEWPENQLVRLIKEEIANAT